MKTQLSDADERHQIWMFYVEIRTEVLDKI